MSFLNHVDTVCFSMSDTEHFTFSLIYYLQAELAECKPSLLGNDKTQFVSAEEDNVDTK